MGEIMTRLQVFRILDSAMADGRSDEEIIRDECPDEYGLVSGWEPDEEFCNDPSPEKCRECWNKPAPHRGQCGFYG